MPKTESHLRSIIKGISWRIIGTIDTIIISQFVTNDTEKALKIGFTEVFSKIFLYYIHERIWIYFSRKKENHSHSYSVAKTISWRIVGTTDTLILGWIYTGNALSGLTIAGVELVTKMLLYYLHERIWENFPIGTVRRWFGLKRD